MKINVSKVRTQAVLRQGSPLLLLSIILLIAGGAIQLVLGHTAFGAASWLFLPDSYLIATIAVGILLLLTRKTPELYFVALLILIPIFNLMGTGGGAVCWALLLMLVSAIGVPGNIAPSFLPQPIRIPVLNLAAGLLTLVGALQSLEGADVDALSKYRLEAFRASKLTSINLIIPVVVALLLFAGILLLSLSVEAQTVDAAADPRQLTPRMQSIPRLGERLLTIGAALLILYYAAAIVGALWSSKSVSTIPSILRLYAPGLIAGILLLNQKGHSRHYLVAMALLLVPVAVNTLAGVASGTYTLLFLLPALLMLLAAIGVPWNITLTTLPKGLQIPALNLAAAALLVARIVRSLFVYLRSILDASDKLAQIGLGLKSFIPFLLLSVGLILLNLCLDAREVHTAMERPDGTKYKAGLFGLVGRFYQDVGGNLQKLAKIQGIICLVLAGLSVLAMALGLVAGLLGNVLDARDLRELFVLVPSGAIGVLSSLVLAVATWPLYAFGQITSDVHKMSDKGSSIGGTSTAPAAGPQEENPDDLPEL